MKNGLSGVSLRNLNHLLSRRVTSEIHWKFHTEINLSTFVKQQSFQFNSGHKKIDAKYTLKIVTCLCERVNECWRNPWIWLFCLVAGDSSPSVRPWTTKRQVGIHSYPSHEVSSPSERLFISSKVIWSQHKFLSSANFSDNRIQEHCRV